MNSIKVYNYKCYRSFIKELVEAKKKKFTSLTYSRIAESSGMQKSYLSQVLSGKGYLNSDQVFLIGKKLGLKVEEIDYLQLLLEYERCQIPERKKLLEKQILKIQSQHSKSKDYIDYEAFDKVANESYTRYYSDPYCSLVHIFLTIEVYRKEPTKILPRLNISGEKLGEILEKLEDCGILEFKNGSIHLLKNSLHLDSESWLSRVSATMHRLKAIEIQQKSADEKDYFFTASFSANEDTRQKVKKKFLEFLKEATSEISESESEDVFQINFDLFRV